MEDNKSMEVFAKAPIRKAVLQNALPAMAAMHRKILHLHHSYRCPQVGKTTFTACYSKSDF